MRIGFLLYGSLETVSGGYFYDRKLVEYLRDQGDQVDIISLPWRGYLFHLLDNFSSNLINQLQDLSIDLLIQDELNHPSLAWLNQKIDVSYPIIALVHHLRCKEVHPSLQNRFYRWVEKEYLNSVDGFIFNSQTTRATVGELSTIKPRPWVVANPAGDRFNPQVNVEQIGERAYQPGPLKLLFLGNIIPRKGLHTLILALNNLPSGTCTLDVVGNLEIDRAYGRSVQRLVRQLELSDDVQFHAALEDGLLYNMMMDSQLLVVPSSYEGFGIVYLEGMGFGLPGIGTHQGAAAEIILPDQNGYLIEAEDSASLANILLKLHQDRGKLAMLGAAAKLRFNQFPSWEESMAKVAGFLSEVLQLGGRSQARRRSSNGV